MNLLLDSCVILWLMLERERLAPALLGTLADRQNKLFVSAASTWEMLIKYRAGKLTLPKSPAQFFADLKGGPGMTSLPLDEDSALQLTKLPKLHADPFDRMLICQAIENGLTIVTPDEKIRQYPVKTLWV